MLRFDSSIDVVAIPSHAAYTDSMRKSIWSTRKEIAQNARRNRREFASENWKWEDVIEEDQMFYDQNSHTHIHPVHIGFGSD